MKRETIVSESTVTPATAEQKTEPPFNEFKALLTLAFGCLWIADACVTGVFVKKHGLEMEANPIMRWVLEQWGFGGMMMVKFVVLSFWIALHQRAHWGIHVALNVLMATVVCMGIIVARG
jgi:hypothetical protein